jgi:putative hydrolase of HD superfamily
MSKEENVVRYYVLCNKLKDVIRTGWKDWNVKKERLESVAEHIYGTQMLALAMKSEYNYDIDIFKVLYMLALHELEEIVIGDLTLFQISKEEKKKIGHDAINKVLNNLIDKDKMVNIILEFDERKTKEAIFAHYCDKLECDIQSKLYDKYVDLNDQDSNNTFNDSKVQELLQENNSFSWMWLKFGQQRYNYDPNFKAVSDFVLNTDISKYQEYDE